jgi:hypothetical protein
MKPKTAVGLLDLAFSTDDLEAFEQACLAKPWVSVSFNPLQTIAADLENAKEDRKRKIADARARVKPYLSFLAQYGHPANASSLCGLRNADRPSFIEYAKAALSFSAQHKSHQLILHRLAERKSISPKCVEELLTIGFDKNLQDNVGNTIAHVIIKAIKKAQKPEKAMGFLTSLQVLQKADADFTLTNKAGVSAGDAIGSIVGAFSGHDEFCEMLSGIQAQMLSAATVQIATAPAATARRL